MPHLIFLVHLIDPPRNPAEKISSGYKAWEFLTYLFGLGPGLLHGVLPDKYWKNYCKLVAGMRIVHQRSISQEQLIKSHHLLVEFVKEFEELYYQRKESRLHFCRQSIHALLHLAPEIVRLGPGVCYTQWPMERTIGTLVEEIRQPSNPYQNMSGRGVRRAQVNTLVAMMPEFDPPKAYPRCLMTLETTMYCSEQGERNAHAMPERELTSLVKFYQERGVVLPQNWTTHVQRWARLRLPNEQIVRSSWKEKATRSMKSIRIARNIMVRLLI